MKHSFQQTERSQTLGTKYQLVIFDFDGTLADSFPWAARVVNQFADRYGFKRVDAADHAHLRSYDARSLMEHLGVRMWKVPAMAVEVRRRMAEEIDQIALFSGVDEMLRTLKNAGILLAVVSSNSESNVRTVLGPENAALFSLFECGVSVFGKAAKIKTVLKHHRIAPQAAILIGDEIRDAEAARKVGVAFGAVAWGYTNPEALLATGPDEFFETVEQIARRLRA